MNKWLEEIVDSMFHISALGLQASDYEDDPLIYVFLKKELIREYKIRQAVISLSAFAYAIQRLNEPKDESYL